MSANLISITPNYMEVIKIACGKPYGNNVSEKGVERIIQSGHISVIEHAYASFDLVCSVRVLGQLTRHRHFSFTVKSARGSQFDNMVIPQGLKEYLKGRDMGEFIRGMLAEYNQAIDSGVAEEDAAYLLPQGIETTLVMSGNFRTWFEYLPKRLCKRAMPEHRELAMEIHKELKKYAPEIFDRNFLNCANCTERGCDFK